MLLRLIVVLLASNLAAAEAAKLSFDARVNATRAVERARYRFVINATEPFDKVYPRDLFIIRVRRQMDEERLLKSRYGLSITAEMLADEFRRIEVTTKDEEQWNMVKSVLGNNRQFIEEIFCRPLLSTRLLRAKFDLDREIHAERHQKARKARASFLSKKKRVPDATVVHLSREGKSGPTTDEMLDHSRSEAQGPRVLSPQPQKAETTVHLVEPEVSQILEKQLRSRGDVSTILEHRDRFVVYRAVEIRNDRWIVEAVVVPKVDFDRWFEQARRN
jgi:hypothetical protein